MIRPPLSLWIGVIVAGAVIVGLDVRREHELDRLRVRVLQAELTAAAVANAGCFIRRSPHAIERIRNAAR